MRAELRELRPHVRIAARLPRRGIDHRGDDRETDDHAQQGGDASEPPPAKNGKHQRTEHDATDRALDRLFGADRGSQKMPTRETARVVLRGVAHDDGQDQEDQRDRALDSANRDERAKRNGNVQRREERHRSRRQGVA